MFIRESWPIPGGLQYHLIRQCQEMKKLGLDCEIYTRFVENQYSANDYFWHSEPERVFDNEGIKTHVIGLSLWEKLFLLPLKKLHWRESTLSLAIAMLNIVFKSKLIKLFKGYDLVHYDGGGMELMSYSVRAACDALGIPFVVLPSCHAGHWGNLPVDHRLFRSADGVLARTNVEREYLIKVAGVKPEYASHVGSGTDEISGGDGRRFRSEYNIPSDAPVILFVGRLSRDKGYGLLREAFQIVKSRIKDVYLVCVGKESDLHGRYDDDETRVILTGFVSAFPDNQTLRDAYDSCNILCAPSEGESFGIIFIEAGMAGKPVVCRKLNVLQELIGEANAGILVGTQNADGSADVTVDEIAEALVTLLEDDELAKKLGKNGLEASVRYLWPNIISRFIRAYDDICERYKISR